MKVIEYLGSSLNFKKKGLRKLLRGIILGKISRIIITYKDRLLRFGTEILSYICKLKNIEIIIICQQQQKSYQDQLTEDVLAILTVYGSKIYGRRSHEKRKKAKAEQEKKI